MKLEHLYEQVADELAEQGPKRGLWAMCIAEANGAEPQAKALYLRYRVEQLQEAEQAAARERANRPKSPEELSAEEERGNRQWYVTCALLFGLFALIGLCSWIGYYF